MANHNIYPRESSNTPRVSRIRNSATSGVPSTGQSHVVMSKDLDLSKVTDDGDKDVLKSIDRAICSLDSQMPAVQKLPVCATWFHYEMYYTWGNSAFSLSARRIAEVLFDNDVISDVRIHNSGLKVTVHNFRYFKNNKSAAVTTATRNTSLNAVKTATRYTSRPNKMARVAPVHASPSAHRYYNYNSNSNSNSKSTFTSNTGNVDLRTPSRKRRRMSEDILYGSTQDIIPNL